MVRKMEIAREMDIEGEIERGGDGDSLENRDRKIKECKKE